MFFAERATMHCVLSSGERNNTAAAATKTLKTNYLIAI